MGSRVRVPSRPPIINPWFSRVYVFIKSTIFLSVRILPFWIIFIGAILAVAIVPIFYFNLYPKNIFWLFITAFIIYWVGAFGVTIFGNIPLNEILDKTNLESITLEEIKTLRKSIELKWNNYNLISCISSGITFILLIVSFLTLCE